MSGRSENMLHDDKSVRGPSTLYLKALWQNLRDALGAMPRLERYAHIFWLSGPFILLIERTPADIWVVILGVAFATRSIVKRDVTWLTVAWVRFAFFF